MPIDLVNVFAAVFTVDSLIAIALGAFVGYFAGVLPGLNTANVGALLVGVLALVSPFSAVMFMASMYGAAGAGDSVPAIAFNVPGDPGAGPAAIEGYPLTRAGKGRYALGISLFGAAGGAIVGSIMAMIGLAYFGNFALRLGPVELLALTTFGVAGTAALSSGSVSRGLLAAAVGGLVGLAGTDPAAGDRRGVFGIVELFDGFPLLAVVLGVFGISEAFALMIEGRQARAKADRQTQVDPEILEQHKESGHREMSPEEARPLRTAAAHIIADRRMTGLASVLGMVFGVLPGIGRVGTSFLAYSYAKTFAKHPEKFTKGSTEGLIASEWSSNVVTPASLIPLFSLGIPGSAVGAIMLTVLLLSGHQPGPMFYAQYSTQAQAIILGSALGVLMAVVFGILASRYVVRIANLPPPILVLLILVFSFIGAYAERQLAFDMLIAIAFGVIGYLMRLAAWSVPAFVVAYLLIPMIEAYLLQVQQLGAWETVSSSPIALIVFALTLVMLVGPPLLARRRRRRTTTQQIPSQTS